jgi:hypothetical protein
MKNLGFILQEAGSSFENVLKCTVYLLVKIKIFRLWTILLKSIVFMLNILKLNLQQEYALLYHNYQREEKLRLMLLLLLKKNLLPKTNKNNLKENYDINNINYKL